MTDYIASDMESIGDLASGILSSYTDLRTLHDGRVCGVHRLLFHWTMHIDIDNYGYADSYCYRTREAAVAAMHKWSGEGDPEGWHRHPKTGRRRDYAKGEEWVAY